MIRVLRDLDLPSVMEIWLEGNRKAHDFVPESYWAEHYGEVKEILPQAQVLVYEDEESGEILGFIGLTGSYIAGIFVKEAARSRGIGRQLLDHVKERKGELRLSVYQKNVRAAAFYEREGFKVEKEQTDSDTGEKEFVMRWRN